MENFYDHIFQAAFVSGIIFFAMGLIILLFPPKKPNSVYGYKTMTAQRSQERWDFAQRYSSLVMIAVGIVMAAASFAGYFLDPDSNAHYLTGIFIAAAGIALIFFITERALSKRFKK